MIKITCMIFTIVIDNISLIMVSVPMRIEFIVWMVKDDLHPGCILGRDASDQLCIKPNSWDECEIKSD